MKKSRKKAETEAKEKSKAKGILQKIWYFIWEDNSVWSWIANIILAFILIKFVVYPGLGYALSTSHPVVAVVSGSMEHDGSFDQWWNSNAICNHSLCTQKEFYNSIGINKTRFRSFIFKNGFNTGDIIILHGIEPEKIGIGDVIVFNSDLNYPIIHRVIKKEYKNNRIYFTTKGDHNEFSGKEDKNISQDKVIGKAIFRIPYLGRIKMVFAKALSIFGINMK